jgi:hypothetical protein
VIADRFNDDIYHQKLAWARLARHILKKWVSDGQPSDFSYLDINDTSQGTWKDFWQDVANLDRAQPSLIYQGSYLRYRV